ncbi:MAG: hypothetical protein ACREKL_10995 [Chthoniobacterales bacterium]
MKRILLLLLAAAFSIPLLGISLFYGYENWIGRAAWSKAEAILKAAGEPMSMDALRPKPVPDAMNMAAAPIFQQIFTFYSPQRAEVYGLHLPPATGRAQPTAGLVALARRFHSDFTGDAAAAARVILDGLQPMEPMLQAIREAAERPASVWPLKYQRGEAVPTPFLPPLRQTVEVLFARAEAAIAENDSATAMAEFELITRLARDANQPPLLVTCLAEQAMLGCALNIVRDGLAQDVWSDEQLVRIGETLSRFRPLDSFAGSVRGERALFLASPEMATAKTEPQFTLIDFRTPTSEWISTVMCRVAWDLRPSGWMALDRASYSTFTQDWLSIVLRKGFVRPWALKDWNAKLRTLRHDPVELFRTPVTAFALATFTPVARRAAYMQTSVDLTRLACAIELHRRATGSVPKNLAGLAPQQIATVPRDAVGGSPYFYRATNGGSFMLYGRGWNARDDGGSSANANVLIGPSSADDWVWQPGPHPQRQASVN